MLKGGKKQEMKKNMSQLRVTHKPHNHNQRLI